MRSHSYYEFPLQKPTPGVPVAEGGNAYRRLTGAMVHPSQSVKYFARGSNGWGGDSNVSNNPLKTPDLCLPPIWGSVGGDSVLFLL
jgi:hypothetical protein